MLRMAIQAKTGRKKVHHVTKYSGETIDGLSLMPDGRWRVIGTQIRFTEPDERKAVLKFFVTHQPFATPPDNCV
jgi:hypothetical protein